MAVTASNLVLGPGTLYLGDFGATEPTDTAVNASPAASAWTDVGATKEGFTINVNLEYTELEVDQLVDIPERRLTKRDVQFGTSMAEPTLENFKRALNGGAITSGSGFKAYDPADDVSSTQATYTALLFDGYAPSGLNRRFIARKTLSVETIESAYKKDEQTVWPVMFASHWVSNSIKPFRVIDEVAA